MQFRVVDLLLFALMFVFVVSFPVDLIPVADTYRTIIMVGLRLIVLTYYIYIIHRNRIKIFGVASIKNALLCLPFALISFSNFTASWVDGGFNGVSMTTIDFVLAVIMSLLTAIIEEIVFRLFIQNALINTSTLRRILGSAAIFALMHLLNLVSVRYVSQLVAVLEQAVYAFGLGLLLGILYEYSHSLTAAIVIHFIFNFFNQTLYVYLGGYCSDLAYYLRDRKSVV